MKFRFLGDLDAPEWFLREIMTLSRMTYVRIKLLVMHIAANICGAPMDYDKVKLLVSTAEMTPSDIKATLTTIRFALCKATQYDADATTFGDELTQLGLPNEHSLAMMRVYTTYKERLRAALMRQSLALPGLSIAGWRADLILATGCGGKVEGATAQCPTPVARIFITHSDPKGMPRPQHASLPRFASLHPLLPAGAPETTAVSVGAGDAEALLAELKKAMAMMETAENL